MYSDPIRSAGYASIAVALILLCPVILYSNNPNPQLLGSMAALLFSEILLFMSMRKFANKERVLGIQFVKKANILGFAGIILMLWGTAEIGGPSAYPIMAIMAVLLAVTWFSGKKHFLHW